MHSASFLGLALAAASIPLTTTAADCNAPQKIFAASYAGGISTLTYNPSDNTLTNTTHNPDCGPNAVWLELDKTNKVLFCTDELNGALYSFSTADDGTLSKLAENTDVVYAPVSSILFNKDENRAIALANYASDPSGGPGVTTLTAPLDGKKLDIISYTDLASEPGSGVVSGRQDAPHPHQVLLDPTGSFILVPDLGSDKVRIYTIDLSTNNLADAGSVDAAPGSGPRHGIFWSPSGPVASGYDKANPLFYILTHELSNALVVYKVTYPEDGKIALEEVPDAATNTFGGAEPPEGAVASEVQISADNKFFYAANRLDASFTIPNPDPSNSTQVPSDSLAVFALNEAGKLDFVHLAAAGGVNPRHFSLNKAGTLVALGLMGTNQVVLLKRDPATGRIGEPAAVLNEANAVTTVVFDE